MKRQTPINAGGNTTTRRVTISMERRRELVDMDGVTLDGRPARINGSQLDFPSVASLDGKMRGEWCWEAVDHVVTHNGRAFTL